MPAADRTAPLEEKVGAVDTARAETELPLAPAAVFDFLCEVERIFRLNPLLAIESWQPRSDSVHLVADNESNGRRIEAAVRIVVAPDDNSISLHYGAGLKQATHIRVEPAVAGTRLIVTEHYPRIEDPQDPRVVEVDKSLLPWVAALRRHLLARARWGRLPGWRWWHERFMLSMVPRSRRIVRLLVWISALEFALFLGAVAVLRLAA